MPRRRGRMRNRKTIVVFFFFFLFFFFSFFFFFFFFFVFFFCLFFFFFFFFAGRRDAQDVLIACTRLYRRLGCAEEYALCCASTPDAMDGRSGMLLRGEFRYAQVMFLIYILCHRGRRRYPRVRQKRPRVGARERQESKKVVGIITLRNPWLI